ncbi:MAG: NAD(P)H-dependent flavin oxidoreductase [Thermoanaerobaculia bacterium]
MNELLDRIGFKHPIILAPMGGGPGTPALVAAVANAGGLGSMAGAYLTPHEIRAEFARIRELTKHPININLFAAGYHAGAIPDAKPMLAILERIHQRLGIAPPALPAAQASPFPEQLNVVLDLKPEVFSFTFGVPSAYDVSRLHDRGIFVIGTATTVEEARILAAANIDAIVAQGSEAGAHRGTFAGAFERSMVPTLDLVDQIVASVKVPVIASGGLMDGRDIARALGRGALAAQLGTAFLACPESGASSAYKQAVLAAKEDTTVITRAYSGRHARGLRNEFIDTVPADAILPFPVQNSLTRPMRAAAARRGDSGFLSLWAGTGVTRTRAMPASELMAALISEI